MTGTLQLVHGEIRDRILPRKTVRQAPVGDGPVSAALSLLPHIFARNCLHRPWCLENDAIPDVVSSDRHGCVHGDTAGADFDHVSV